MNITGVPYMPTLLSLQQTTGLPNTTHTLNVNFCNCNPIQPMDQQVQLLWRGWFPATLDCPWTAFTFDCLETFHELTLQGKVNLYDFYHTILRKTDNANLNKSIVSVI